MRREGSPWTGLGTVFRKEMADHLTSARMRILESLIVLIAAGTLYTGITALRDTVTEDRFLFLRLFTLAQEPLPSFLSFLTLFVPLMAIALGFDAINGEYTRRTLSRVLAQPIYRDALILGKFLAGLATLALTLAALWLLVTGFGLLFLGVPPSGEEVLRGLGFLLVTIAYAGVWLSLAMLLSAIFRQAATAALAGLALWLLFAIFWPIIVQFLAPLFVGEPADLLAAVRAATEQAQTELALGRLSPNRLYGEATLALLNPETRTLGLVFFGQLQGAIVGAPLPLSQSLVLIWPHATALVATALLLFTLTYVVFQRQEIRA
jgi:ABC-2 type transport system permease protein